MRIQFRLWGMYMQGGMDCGSLQAFPHSPHAGQIVPYSSSNLKHQQKSFAIRRRLLSTLTCHLDIFSTVKKLLKRGVYIADYIGNYYRGR